MQTQLAYTTKLAECGSKHLALYLAIREAIAAGLLAAGERLPSTRQLAASYGLSRGSVSLAYEMLAAEGFVRTGIGQGTFAAGLPERGAATKSGTSAANLPQDLEHPQGVNGVGKEKLALSAWGRRLIEAADHGKELGTTFPIRSHPQPAGRRQPAAPNRKVLEGRSVAENVSFVPEGVGERWFPWPEWKAAVAQQWKQPSGRDRKAEESETSQGSLQLRQAIAGRLRRERGIDCEADRIILTSGSMQALVLLSQLLLEEDAVAVTENPCYGGIRRAVQSTGARLLSQRIDGAGIPPADWDARLLIVTPARQFPTGAVLSYERRRQLLDWASRRRAWIIEDDYDSDIRWGGRPIEPLKSLDAADRVIYVGSFSRVMCAGVRIGYAVVPRELVKPLTVAKRLYDPFPAGIAEQLALARWMKEGGYDRHMRRLRRVFGRLEGRLRLGLHERLGELFAAYPADAGLHVYAVWLGTPQQYEALAAECRRRGIEWRDGGIYELPPSDGAVPEPPSALFGFGHLDERQIEAGLATIGECAADLGLIAFAGNGQDTASAVARNRAHRLGLERKNTARQSERVSERGGITDA